MGNFLNIKAVIIILIKLKEAKMNKKLIIIILALIFLTLSTLSYGETLLKFNLISKDKGEEVKINMIIPLSVLQKIIKSEDSFRINRKIVKKEILLKSLDILKRGESFETEIKSEKSAEIVFLKISAMKNIKVSKRHKLKKMIIKIKDNEDSLDISIPISLVKIFSSIIKNSIEDEVGESKVLLDYIFSPYKYIDYFKSNEIPLIEIKSSTNEYVKISFKN